MNREAGFPIWSGICSLVLMISVAGHCCADSISNDVCIECHGREDLRSRRGKSRFIDPGRFLGSVHARHDIGCVSCHTGITAISRQEKTPHVKPGERACGECHKKVDKEYSKSLHARVSKEICYSCHDPHYSVSFRQMSGKDRKGICLKCHDSLYTHRWLPQKQLHFHYLECTACHALNAHIGIQLFIKDRNAAGKETKLRYEQLEPLMRPGAPGRIKNIDHDGDGKISTEELHTFMKKLQENGVPGAALEARILVLEPTHNFTSKGEQAKDCTLCHSRDAKFYSKIVLEIPDAEGTSQAFPVEKGILVSRGQRPFMGDLYLLGESKIRRQDLQEVLAVVKRMGFKWIDLIGTCVVLFCLCAVAFHSSLMLLTRKLRARPDARARVESTPFAVRAWHWVHGLCVILLILTGVQLRLPDVAPVFATFLNAVNLHNLCGAVVIVDYLFWLVYHLWKRQFISRFFISPRVFFRDTAEMLHYYGYLIFVGESYPQTGGKYSVFDPVERSFFLTTMLLFLPIQIITGILLFDVHAMMPAIQLVGGLRLVGALHVLFAYLLFSSMVIHLYFQTLKRYRRVVGSASSVG